MSIVKQTVTARWNMSLCVRKKNKNRHATGTGLGLKEMQTSTCTDKAGGTHPSRARFPFFYNGFPLFWKISTPLISSPTEVLPSVDHFLGPSHPFLLFSGVIGKKGRIMTRVGGSESPEEVVNAKKFNNRFNFFCHFFSSSLDKLPCALC